MYVSLSLFVCLVSEAIADPLVETYIQQGMETANELSISRAARVQVSSCTIKTSYSNCFDFQLYLKLKFPQSLNCLLTLLHCKLGVGGVAIEAVTDD